MATAAISLAAHEHGILRREQGYTVAMVVEESRILQVSIFNTLNNRAGTANSDRGISGGSVHPQAKMAVMRRADDETTPQEP